MRVYTCTDFTGHYPVGTAAVVIAPNRKRAVELLEKELKNIGLEQKVNPLSLIVLSIRAGKTCIVLRNGDY